MNYIREKNNEKECSILTYIWIDGTGENLRSKTRVLYKVFNLVKDIPMWNFDGSSTGQVISLIKSDILLQPVYMCLDPFQPGPNNYLVLCDTYLQKDQPGIRNYRNNCFKNHNKALNMEPYFAFEQEYVLLGKDNRPFDWPKNGFPDQQGPYYCGVGFGKVNGRFIADELIQYLIYAGIAVSGDNAEVMPSQWEYQIGPVIGIEAADQLWVSRYILSRLCEKYMISVTFKPRPVEGLNWNGSGCHTNFSTKLMREENGYDHILEAARKIGIDHADYVKISDMKNGEENKLRLLGKLETSSYDKFTYGIGDRSCSIRIPMHVSIDKKGYLEDRRPSGNCDPYLIIDHLLESILK